MKNIINSLNKEAGEVHTQIKLLNDSCKSLTGTFVIIPSDVGYPLEKVARRHAILRHVSFDEFHGVIHANLDIPYLDNSGKITSYPESNYYIPITEDWFLK